MKRWLTMVREAFFTTSKAFALFPLVPVLATVCGNGDAGLSRAEVDEIVREELADVPAPPEPASDISSVDVEAAIRGALAGMPQPEPALTRDEVEQVVGAAIALLSTPQPGLTFADVEAAIGTALATIPEPQLGLTSDEAEKIARGMVATMPPRSAPAEYTRFFVERAISRYDTEGPDTTLAYYNREESVDGPWYVFVVDENDLVIGHPDAHRLGLDLKGWVGTDATGYNSGPDMLSATEEGKWVSYVYGNPVASGGLGSDHTGALEYKHVWTVRRDALHEHGVGPVHQRWPAHQGISLPTLLTCSGRRDWKLPSNP